MIRPLLFTPDPRLRLLCAPVGDVTPTVATLIDDLIETMYAIPACALSAPQVGVPLKIFVLDLASEDLPNDRRASGLRVFLNPKILLSHDPTSQTVRESCASCPGAQRSVVRRATVRVQARDRHGEPFYVVAEGDLAAAILHEVDHLHGKTLR